MVGQMESKKRKAAYSTWGNGFYKNLPFVAPLRGALSVWGLGVDDIAVGSFHGTSTTANDKNESDVVNQQMEHLGRTPGNPLWVVAQKWLTGHPKGAAAAWMLNGVVQCMLSGVVPGNRNLDNCAAELQKFEHLAYPNRSVALGDGRKVKAGLLKSFGNWTRTLSWDLSPCICPLKTPRVCAWTGQASGRPVRRSWSCTRITCSQPCRRRSTRGTPSSGGSGRMRPSATSRARSPTATCCCKSSTPRRTRPSSAAPSS